MRGDDLVVELGAGVEVVVVVVETGGGEFLRLAGAEQAQRQAGFHAEVLDRAHHLDDAVEIAILRPAPGRAHAEAAGAPVLRRFRRHLHLFELEQLLALDANLVLASRRLRAVAAVLGTTAGLDRQQRRALDGIGVEMLAMHLLGAEHQVGERQLEQRLDGIGAPAGRLLRDRGARVSGGGGGSSGGHCGNLWQNRRRDDRRRSLACQFGAT